VYPKGINPSGILKRVQLVWARDTVRMLSFGVVEKCDGHNGEAKLPYHNGRVALINHHVFDYCSIDDFFNFCKWQGVLFRFPETLSILQFKNADFLKILGFLFNRLKNKIS
jgi:hypothetical protein